MFILHSVESAVLESSVVSKFNYNLYYWISIGGLAIALLTPFLLSLIGVTGSEKMQILLYFILGFWISLCVLAILLIKLYQVSLDGKFLQTYIKNLNDSISNEMKFTLDTYNDVITKADISILGYKDSTIYNDLRNQWTPIKNSFDSYINNGKLIKTDSTIYNYWQSLNKKINDKYEENLYDKDFLELYSNLEQNADDIINTNLFLFNDVSGKIQINPTIDFIKLKQFDILNYNLKGYWAKLNSLKTLIGDFTDNIRTFYLDENIKVTINNGVITLIQTDLPILQIIDNPKFFNNFNPTNFSNGGTTYSIYNSKYKLSKYTFIISTQDNSSFIIIQSQYSIYILQVQNRIINTIHKIYFDDVNRYFIRTFSFNNNSFILHNMKTIANDELLSVNSMLTFRKTGTELSLKDNMFFLQADRNRTIIGLNKGNNTMDIFYFTTNVMNKTIDISSSLQISSLFLNSLPNNITKLGL